VSPSALHLAGEVTDLLESAQWECAAAPPGRVQTPADLDEIVHWWPAVVPGTAAGALRAAGAPDADVRDYDAEDWFFRTEFVSPAGDWLLSADGLATVADVWVDGAFVVHSENMFRRVRRPLRLGEGRHELVVRCGALRGRDAPRRRRPRWKTYLVVDQNLRYFRTSLLGRIPGWAAIPPPVGPWRALRIGEPVGLEPRDVRVLAGCSGSDGVVEATFTVPDPRRPDRGSEAVPTLSARLEVEGRSAPLRVRRRGDELVLSGRVRVPEVVRWWPHTHGDQPLYTVRARVRWSDGESGGFDGDRTVEREIPLGRVGFREVVVDQSDAGFSVSVNGVAIFCRGACWFPPDPVSPGARPELVTRTVELARAANCNMLRVPGTGVYPGTEFFERCDELGIMVWQDCMFAFTDPPDDAAFEEEVVEELTEVFSGLARHPSLALVCGNQEVEEIAAMLGLPEDRRDTPLFTKRVPDVLSDVVPDVPYVSSTPSGGAVPFEMHAGTCQYFGIGGYLRPLEDVRRSDVRFASECLAFSNPPEPAAVEEHHGGPTAAGHDPEWKRSVHHDAGRSWDMEDVRDHYVSRLFDVDPLRLRYEHPERALDLGRATNAALMEEVFSEWRRPGSSCAGGLVLGLHDLRRGSGWGVVDFDGRPKAPWYALRRVFAPLALLVTDEGLNGLDCHVINDTGEEFCGRLVVTLVARGELVIEEASVPVQVPARGARTIGATTVLQGFRDISYAYRFSPPAHDAVVVTLRDPDDAVSLQRVYLPLGQARPREADLGLEAWAEPDGPRRYALTVRTRRLAQWVAIDAPGFAPEDSWFHLAPGGERRLALEPVGTPGRLRGRVRALNAEADCRIEVRATESGG